jgi:hypothetical protein
VWKTQSAFSWLGLLRCRYRLSPIAVRTLAPAVEQVDGSNRGSSRSGDAGFSYVPGVD